MATEQELIIRLRAKNERLEADLKRAQRKIKGFGNSVNRISAGIQQSMINAFGGLAIAEGIRRGITSLSDFEFAMDKVGAISGATSDQMEDLRDNALELGRTTKFTATEISGLQLELSKLGFSPERILASTDAIRKLATVADEDLGESAKTLAGTLNSFNLEATESEKVANIMAESFSKSALTLEKFTVATANSGAIANALGVTLEQNTARIGALVDANIDASKAGTDLRKIYVELNKAGIDYDSALDMVAGSSDKVGKATELVGIRAAGALVILSEMRGKVDDLTGSLSDTNLELDHMVGVMEDNLLTDWKKFTSAMDGAVQKGSVLNDILRASVQTLTGMVNGLTNVSKVQQDLNRAGIDESNFFGLSDEAQAKLFKFYHDLDKEVKAAIEDIKEGTRTFDGQSIAALDAADAINVVNSRLEAYKQNRFYEDIKKAAIPITDQLTKKIKEQAAATEILVQKQRELRKAYNLAQFAAFTGSTIDAEILGASSLGISAESIDAINEKVGTAIENFRVETTNQIASVNMEVVAFATDMISGIADALGRGDGIEGAFNNILMIFGDGLQRLGKALIAYGVLMVAAQAALKNPFANIGGVGAIAAGGIAVAAGAALKSSVSNTNSSLSSGGGGSGGSARSFSQNRTQQEVRVTGEIKASGRDLVLVLNNQQQFNDRARA